MIVSDEALDAWVRKSWDTPPPFSRSALRAMYVEDLERAGKARAQDLQTRELRDLQKRLAQLERKMNRDLVPAIGEAIGKNVASLVRRIEVLERRVPLDFRGIWHEGEQYLRGDCVTCKGGLWIALVDNDERPNKSSHWRLAIKNSELDPGVA